MTEPVRALLRGGAPVVLVEAPAGCGKTHEAVALALDTVPTLNDGQCILLLAHTNAAKEEFTRRTKVAASRVAVSTIDSFSARLLSHYASAFGLPSPLSRHLGQRGDRIPFSDLSKYALELFQRAPTIARLLSAKYPIIIGDEHQDASATQHALLTTLAKANGSRLRLFGDPMQAIFETDDPVTWDQVELCADETCALAKPMRWRDNPALGEWTLHARRELASGRSLRLNETPESVTVIRCQRTNGAAFKHSDSRTIATHALGFVKRVGQDSFSILTYPNSATMTIESVVHKLGVGVNEGAEYEQAYAMLDTAIAAEGGPRSIAICVLDHLKSSCVGISTADYERIESALRENTIHRPPRGRLSAFTPVFEPIYADRSITGFLQACRQALSVTAPKFRLRKRLALQLLATLNKEDPGAVQDELSGCIASRNAIAKKPTRTASTIHKAKGLEFQHVLIAYCGRSHFPDNEQSRRRLYVALSRATSSLSFHVPNTSPSPLLE